GVDVGLIFAKHTSTINSGLIRIRAALVQARTVILQVALLGAELTKKDAKHFGDAFLLSVAILKEKLPKEILSSINLFGIALEIATKGVTGKLNKFGEQVGIGGNKLAKRLLDAVG